MKREFKEFEFDDVYVIPFSNSGHEQYKKHVSSIEEFGKMFSEKYTKITNLLLAVKESSKKDISRQVFGHAQAFYLSCVKSLKIRLPFQNKILNLSQIIYLKDKSFAIENWLELAKYFPNIINKEEEVAFIDELDSFSIQYKTIMQDHANSGVSILKRWCMLMKEYPHLASLARVVLVIPYSTSRVESLFSEFKALKTPYRNRLNVDNLEASILGQQYFREDESRILPEMRQKYLFPKKVERKEKIIEIKAENLPEISILNNAEGPEKLIKESNVQPNLPSPNDFLDWLTPMLPILYAQYTAQKKGSSVPILYQNPSSEESNKRKALYPLEPDHSKGVKFNDEDIEDRPENSQKVEMPGREQGQEKKSK